MTRAKGLGVTDSDYAAMLERQGGGCAICGNPPKTRRLHVDHDHKTGAVRGLLCFQCNRLLLIRGITPERLENAASYLRDPAEHVLRRARARMWVDVTKAAAEHWTAATRSLHA